MEKGEKLTGGPYWTQNWIEAMWRFTAERFVDFDTGTVDFEALGREEYEFRKALFFRNFKNSPRAREAFDAAADDYSKKVANGQKGGRPRKSITADGDTREHSRGRYAPPSCSPDDGNPAETAPSHGGSVASLEARQSQTLESQRRAGAASVRGTPLHSAPARSPARKFRNKEEFIQWAIDTGLDPNDAGDCWEATMERGGLTKDGKKVENICAYAVKWCSTAKEKRSKSA